MRSRTSRPRASPSTRRGCFFKTPKRDYIIIDAPGHIEFLKNMVTGRRPRRGRAAGHRRQGRRAGELPPARLHDVHARHPADRRAGQQDGPGRLRASVVRRHRPASTPQFLEQIGVTRPRFIPVAGARGRQHRQSARPTWRGTQGPTVLEALDQFQRERRAGGQPFRMPVQDVYKFTKQGDDRRIIAGHRSRPARCVGDEVVFYPSGKRSQVKINRGVQPPAPQTEAQAGRPTGLHACTEQIYVARGELATRRPRAAAPGDNPAPGEPRSGWASSRWSAEGLPPQARHGAGRRRGSRRSTRVIDASDLDAERAAKGRIDRHDVAECVLKLSRADRLRPGRTRSPRPAASCWWTTTRFGAAASSARR